MCTKSNLSPLPAHSQEYSVPFVPFSAFAISLENHLSALSMVDDIQFLEIVCPFLPPDSECNKLNGPNVTTAFRVPSHVSD